MTSHYAHEAWTRPSDYAGARFIQPHHLAALNGEPVDLVEQLKRQAEARAEREAEAKIIWRQRLIAYACCLLSAFAVIYFAAEFVRSLLVRQP